MIGFLHSPKPRVFAAFYPMGIGNIVDVLDIGPAACAFADQADCIGTGVDPAVHLVIPRFNVRTGDRIRALDID